MRGPGRYYRYEISAIESLPHGGEVIRSHRFRTVQCVAQHFNISESTARRWIRGEVVNGWKSKYVLEKIKEPAVEEVTAQNVLLTNLDE